MAADVLDTDVDERGHPCFAGLRMGVAEFLELPDDGFKYELVDGVAVMSPSPLPAHQEVAVEVAYQIKAFLRSARVGRVFTDIDVHLGAESPGKDLVYKPDVVFVREERIAGMAEKIVGAPDLVVEVISRGSRRMDTITKRGDYERFGVGEYWIFDPQRSAMTFLRRVDGRFAEVTVRGDEFRSESIPAFVLDLIPIREAFKPW
ncbi:MAG: hypothetical protein AMXMBFR47_32890 [Planctomycetota bacterium]